MFEKFKTFPYFILFRASWRYLDAYRLPYFLAVAGILISQMIGLLTPYIMGKLINQIQHGIYGYRDLLQAIKLALLYFLVTPCVWLFFGPSRIIERQAGFLIHKNYLDELYGKVRQLPYTWHQTLHSGQLVDRIRQSAQALQDFTESQFSYLRFIIDMVGPLAVLLWFFPWAGLVCITMGIIAGFTITRFDKRLVPLYKERNRLSHEEVGVFTDYLANIRTIITLRLGPLTQKELIQRYMAKQKTQWREIRLNEYKWAAISHAADFFVVMLIICILLWMSHGSDLQIGSVVMLIQYLMRFSSVFFNMGSIYQQMIGQATNYQSAQPIEQEFGRQQPGSFDTPPSDVNEDGWQQIRVNDLRFSYKDKMNREHTISDINFTLTHGEKIALVGPSGAGKSTLMLLLRGLYEAEQVDVDIDGKSYNKLSVLRHMTALIPQDPEIFENSILYNITFGVDHPEAEIMRACEIAAFDTVLKNLPEGLNTDIREKGVNLSGGQKQRLALARGVFSIRTSPLILLDEPTSSVDTKTEGHIFDSLFREFPTKTMIASVHRLHLLPLFDRVIVMDQGKIVEQGPFAELIKGDGLLREMWLNYQHATRKTAEPVAETPSQS